MISIYRALLHLYPASWRAEYGDEMAALFADRRRAASSGIAILALSLEALADLLTGAAAIQFDHLRQDLRYTARTFRRAPGFAATAIAIAAVGIGATTAAFTMVDHVLIRPLPFAHQERIVKLYEDHPAQGSRFVDMSPANYRDWKRMSKSFQLTGAFRGLSVNLTGQGDPRTLDGASVTSEIFPLLGVQPALGRYFDQRDDSDSAPGTAVLSYGLWQSEFGADPNILGRAINLYEIPYIVIGVMPKSFYFPSRAARLWTPMRWAPRDFEDRLNTYIFGIARLKPDVSLQQAQAELSTIAGQLARAYPKELARTGATVILLRDDVSPQALLMLKVLLAAALCVLLIACTNLANLLLARAMVRRRELAVRTALGAGRERLIRQMLTESLVLALAGGSLGLLIARSALPLLVRLVPTSLPIAEVPPIDIRVLLFTLLLIGVTGIVFGIIPALRIFRGQNGGDLREGGRSGIGGHRERLRSALVVAEIAGSVVLLVGFGLLTHALWRIQSTDPGFVADRVLTLRTALPIPRYQSASARAPFYRHVLDAARQLPGVTGAAYTSFLPMVNRGGIWPVEIEGRPQDVTQRSTASLRFVTPGFFPAMGIPLLQGRDIAERDTNESPYVAIVSQSFVRRYWTGENPLGRHIDFGNHNRLVIGVVGDIRVRGLERQSEPQVYLSWQQPDDVSPWYAPKDLVVRSGAGTGELVPALRRIIHEADPGQPVSDVRPLTEIVHAETASRRVQLGVLGAFGLTAFLLAAVGIHGLLSFTVSSRTQEIGVRIALGAQRSDIMRMTLRDGFQLAAIGIVIGAALAYGAGRLLASLLAGVQPDDLATFAAACLLALLMTLAGSFLPALRAVRVDPATALRAE
jgi:predicted permease